MKKTPAEVAAQVGTVQACWDAYRDGVVVPIAHMAQSVPLSVVGHCNCSKMDFYAGAAAVFQILHAMYEQGKPPTGLILADLETEVMTFLAEKDPPNEQPRAHKPGHA